MKSSTSPILQFSNFFPSFQKAELLDFGLEETHLIEATKKFCDYIGVNSCYLKLETELPTGTMKDRITELMFSQFKKEKITNYALASTGNTAASLAWAMEKYQEPFKAIVFIASDQLPYHSFKKPTNMTTVLLENATYDESFRYAQKYNGTLLQGNQQNAMSTLRYEASKLSYLEALYQAFRRKLDIDIVCQSISAGVGIIGADKAIQDAQANGWLKRYPQIIVGQPSCANPIEACYNSGSKAYDHQYSIDRPTESLAWPIRRGNAESTFDLIKEILDKSNGFAFKAYEEEILDAKNAIYDTVGITAGYASCVVIAGLHTQRHKPGLGKKNCLIMVTGKDRCNNDIVTIDQTLTEAQWRI